MNKIERAKLIIDLDLAEACYKFGGKCLHLAKKYNKQSWMDEAISNANDGLKDIRDLREKFIEREETNVSDFVIAGLVEGVAKGVLVMTPIVLVAKAVGKRRA